MADEDRTGYDRGLFRHWVDADHDRCSTRVIYTRVIHSRIGLERDVLGAQRS